MAETIFNSASDALAAARQALAEKNAEDALRYATRASQLDPDLEEAWDIMAALSEPEKSIIYLKRALEINPESEKAREGMRWAIKQLKKKQQTVGKSSASKPTASKKKNEPATDSRWGLPLFLSLLTIGTILIISVGIPFLNAQAAAYNVPREKNVLVKPTLTPTLTPTPTSTPTPTPTPTPSPTPTADTSYSSYYYHSWDIPEEVSGSNDFWIEVDLSGQMLYAYRGDQILASFVVSTGTSKYPTVTGAYKVYAKLPSYTMIGPGYNLPDVPYVLFFHKGYSIHGTYWHSNFGTPMSHGCVNMQTNDAAWVYNQSTIGTYVFVHY